MAKKTKENKSAGTGLVKWDEAYAKYAEEAASREEVGGAFISFKSGVIQIAGKPVEGNKLRVVVLDSCFENVYYSSGYNEDEKTPPTCFAIARVKEELKAHVNAKQNWQNRLTVLGPEGKDVEESPCVSCEQNMFGTDDRGKGKACGNKHRLALLSAEGLGAETVRSGEVLYAKLSPLSGRLWPVYVKGLKETLKRPPFGVVTVISTKPDPKSQFLVTFEMEELVPSELTAAIFARQEQQSKETMFPYSVAAAQASGEKRRPEKKKGGKKKF